MSMKRKPDIKEQAIEDFINNSRDKVMFEEPPQQDDINSNLNINIESNSDINSNSNINSNIESNIKINIKNNMKKTPKPKQSPYFVNVSSEYVLAITELIESSGYNKRELTEMALDLLFKKFGVEITKG